jgi:retron-type reverse transcriptase
MKRTHNVAQKQYSPTALQLSYNATMELAYQWLCKQREEQSHNNSVWDLRYNWETVKPLLQNQLLTNAFRLSPFAFRLSPLQSHLINGEYISSWTAIDALVLKALSLTLQPLFTPDEYTHCTHLKNAGGIHTALKNVSCNKSRYHHVLKSDVYHYYESIDHGVLLTLLKQYVVCPILLDLVAQYCQRLEMKDGHYYHFNRGIPKGCSLSPLMAALYLKPLDDEMKQHGFYVRFMDDWIVMVKTKQQLRKIIRLTHKILTQLKLKMHPDKTFLGCIKKGFDFLGIHFGDTLKISKTSQENHHAKIAQRYAQGASAACIGAYVARWTSWCRSVLNCCTGREVIENSKGRIAHQLFDSLSQIQEKYHENSKAVTFNEQVLA